MNKFKQLIEKRNTLVKALSDMLDKADEEKRALTAEEVLAFEAKSRKLTKRCSWQKKSVQKDLKPARLNRIKKGKQKKSVPLLITCAIRRLGKCGQKMPTLPGAIME